MRSLDYYIKRLKKTGKVCIVTPDDFRTDWVEAEVKVKDCKVSVKIRKPCGRVYEETKCYENEKVAMVVAILWVESIWEEARECYEKHKGLAKRYERLQESVESYEEWMFLNAISNPLDWSDKSQYLNYRLGRIGIEYIGATYRVKAVNFKTDEEVDVLAGDEVEAYEVALNIFRSWRKAM